MSSPANIHIGDGDTLAWFDPDDEIRDRWRDVKHAMQARATTQVTNRDVLSVLLELYWLHDERDAADPDDTEGVYL